MTETELKAFVSRLSGVLSFAREQAGRGLLNVRNALKRKPSDPERVLRGPRPSGRGRLCAERVDKFPSLQVILLDEKREFELERDERQKLLGLGVWDIDASAAGKRQRTRHGSVFAGPVA